MRCARTFPENSSVLTLIFGRLLDGPGDPSFLARFLLLIEDSCLPTSFPGIIPCALNSSRKSMGKGLGKEWQVYLWGDKIP